MAVNANTTGKESAVRMDNPVYPALFITISNNAQLARQSLRFMNNPDYHEYFADSFCFRHDNGRPLIGCFT